MKRYDNIYQSIIDINNIKKAIISASKDKKHRQSVKRVLNNLNSHAETIREMLINKTYKPSPYEKMTIYETSSHKERVISKPRFFPDQCIHWSVMLVIKPLLIKRFYPWSCASIDGRGSYYAKNYIEWALKDTKNCRYAYQLDIKKFYPSIDNELLKSKTRNVFKDENLLWLLDTIIDSDKGLPIGNYTSQWLANLYLDDLDKYIKESLKIPYYARYADDMILLAPNKRELQKKRTLIENYITNKEHLKIKGNWKVFKVGSRPIDFIGFRFYQGYTILRPSLYLRIKRRAKKIGKKGKISEEDARAMTSYWGYITNTNSHLLYIFSVKPYCDIKKCKEVISNEAKKHLQSN